MTDKMAMADIAFTQLAERDPIALFNILGW